MSNVITNLCRPIQLKPTPKCVLMALADRADDDGFAWPSIAWLSEWTCFGRTTVIDALKSLESAGLIVISKTQGKQHRCFVDVGSIALFSADPSGSRTPTHPGAVPGDEAEEGADPSGSRTTPCGSRTGTGAVPVREPDEYPSGSRTPTHPGAVPGGTGAVPDTSNTSIKTPIRHRAKNARKPSSFDPMSIELPDWLPAQAWAMWVKYRAESKKPIGEDAARLQLGKLAKFRTQGHDPTLVIEAVIENQWQGLYLPKDGSTKATAPAVAGGADDASAWFRAAGFEHPAEAENARCHIGNYREFREGKRIAEEAIA
jgi:hypothetical protein